MSRVPMPGVTLIKQFEGCHLKAYPDPLSGGRPYTIGWGSTRKKNGRPFELGEEITQAEADELLISQIEGEFLPSLEKIPVWRELNVNQRGAILSFAYNLGAQFYGSQGFETISRVLREKNWSQIQDALVLYRNPGSNVEAGLKRRRLAEAALFKTPSNQPVPDLPPVSAISASSDTSSSRRVLYLTNPCMQGEDVTLVQKALVKAGRKAASLCSGKDCRLLGCKPASGGVNCISSTHTGRLSLCSTPAKWSDFAFDVSGYCC